MWSLRKMFLCSFHFLSVLPETQYLFLKTVRFLTVRMVAEGTSPGCLLITQHTGGGGEAGRKRRVQEGKMVTEGALTLSQGAFDCEHTIHR